ncbi:MAG: linear amide C-N hydrolase [Clostridium sp.]
MTSIFLYLFGRNMDLEYYFGQSVGIIPRNYKYINKATNEIFSTKYAIVGMITMMENHPMFADAMNEKGLDIAGLNFGDEFGGLETKLAPDKINIPSYDLMLWALSNFDNINDLKANVRKLNLMNTQINEKAPAVCLHWIASDTSGESIVIEKTKEGIFVYDNPVGVLTNPPTFDWHLTNLRQFTNTLPAQLTTMCSNMELLPTGRGAVLIGLPGDTTAQSRFIRAAFLRHFVMQRNDVCIGDYFHILDNVAMLDGTAKNGGVDGMSEFTQYSSCMNLEKCTYTYKTYRSLALTSVNLLNEDLDASDIKLFKYKDNLEITNLN